MINVGLANFQSEVLNSEKPVLVDFYGEWCGPCKSLNPTLEKLDKAGDIKVVKVNIDDEQELAEHFDVTVIPTVIAFKSGVKGSRLVGVPTFEKLVGLALGL